MKDRQAEVFTLLNQTYEYVLVNKNQLIPKPNSRKLHRPSDKDTGVFCRYHQYNGHDTESYIALCKIIERLVSEGRLDQYLGTRPAQEQPSNRQINMISDGAPITDSSNRSIKNYVRAIQHPQILSVTEGRHSKIC
ncbi:hypothetical protein L3X38_016980 [Prunus dulcis]|uniref:Uncharacterized protein n=1 Tax=Prunus dulcis TaxID=3755 RepID=A0AAD4W6G4_PRUDU|nr:hypothetical protein L3X38_016980 [Prunus dulcis]